MYPNCAIQKKNGGRNWTQVQTDKENLTSSVHVLQGSLNFVISDLVNCKEICENVKCTG